MSDILLTIVIPTYNNEETIEATISSCLNQDTDVAYEVLIINNASQDNTKNILNQYNDARIRIVTNEETVSLFENHNVGIKNALGQYIIFCHSDDKLEDHAIKILANKLEQRQFPKKYVLWGHSMFRDYSAKFMNQPHFSYNEMVVGQYAPLGLLYGGLSPSGTCYSRESFLEMGGYLHVDGTSPADMTTMIYLAMNGFRFEMIDEMILWRDDASTAPTGGGAKETEMYLQSLDNAFKYFIEKIDEESISNLISLSSSQKNKPFFFYYALAQDTSYRKQIKKIVIRNMMKYPWRLKNALVRKLIKRLYS